MFNPEIYHAYLQSPQGHHPAGRLLNLNGEMHVLEDYYNLLSSHIPEGAVDEYTTHCLNNPPFNTKIVKESDHLGGLHLDLIPELSTSVKMPPAQDVEPLDISAALAVPERSLFTYLREGMDKPVNLESHSNGQMYLDNNLLSDEEKQLILDNLATGLATVSHAGSLAKMESGLDEIHDIPVSNVHILDSSVHRNDPRKIDQLAVAPFGDIPPALAWKNKAAFHHGAYSKLTEDPVDPSFPQVFVSDGMHRAVAAMKAKRPLRVALKWGDHHSNPLNPMEPFAGDLQKMELHEALAHLDSLENPDEKTKNAIAALRQHVFVDPLTGVGNRAAFNAHLKTNPQGVWAVSDLNDFRNINTEFGHHVGDQAIQAKFNAAKAAQQEVGQENMKIFRPMGDEGHYFFHKPEHAYQFIRAFQKHLDAVPNIGGTHKLSVSTGIGPTLEHADQATYAAKEQKKAFKVANPTLQTQTPHFHSTHQSMKVGQNTTPSTQSAPTPAALPR